MQNSRSTLSAGVDREMAPFMKVEDVQIGLTYYWTRGVAAVMEFPDYVSEVRHNTFGTEIRQQAGTENWLHLSLPAIETYATRGPILYGAVFR
jgi:hypothetical protein